MRKEATEYSVNMKEFGERFKKVCEDKNITVKELNEFFGFKEDNRTVYRWWRGERYPKEEYLNALSEEFDISIDYLMNGKENISIEEHQEIIDSLEEMFFSQDEECLSMEESIELYEHSLKLALEELDPNIKKRFPTKCPECGSENIKCVGIMDDTYDFCCEACRIMFWHDLY